MHRGFVERAAGDVGMSDGEVSELAEGARLESV
jgi:hypothetical protein